MPKFTKKGALAGVMAAAMLATAIGSPVAAFATTTQTTPVTVQANDDNLTVTVPTVIPFVMTADGALTSSADMKIVNGSNFGIHLADVEVTAQSPFTIVADATQATEDNAVDFQFGVENDMIDATESSHIMSELYNMEYKGGDDTLTLIVQGNANNIKADVTNEETVANIAWTFAAGHSTETASDV